MPGLARVSHGSITEEKDDSCGVMIVVLTLALLALTGVASAAPTVAFRAAFVPIGGYPQTGNVPGAGTAVEVGEAIKGTEGIGGVPSPLTRFKLYLPAGTGVHPEQLGICTENALETVGPTGCPQTQASPPGSAKVAQKIGSQTVREGATLQAFLSPGGLVRFYMVAKPPISIQQVVGAGGYGRLAGPYGLELGGEFGLIDKLFESPPVSIESISLTLGAARTLAGRTVYYLTAPSSCPMGGMPFKSELEFQTGERTTSTYRAPCPLEGSRIETPLPGTRGVVTAPSNKVCLSRRHFTIHIRQIRDLIYRQVNVDVNGRRVKVVRGARISAPVDLRGLPEGLYAVRITVTTETGLKIIGTRAYHTCAPKPLRQKGNPRL